MLNRIWVCGWVHPKPYVFSHWLFSFSYYPNAVWQIFICGFYLTSTNEKSIVKKSVTADAKLLGDCTDQVQRLESNLFHEREKLKDFADAEAANDAIISMRDERIKELKVELATAVKLLKRYLPMRICCIDEDKKAELKAFLKKIEKL